MQSKTKGNMFNLTNSKTDVFSILAFLLLSFTVLGGCSKPEVMTTKYGDKVTLDNTHKERVIKVVAEFNAIKDSKKIPGVQIGLAYPVDNDLGVEVTLTLLQIATSLDDDQKGLLKDKIVSSFKKSYCVNGRFNNSLAFYFHDGAFLDFKVLTKNQEPLFTIGLTKKFCANK